MKKIFCLLLSIGALFAVSFSSFSEAELAEYKVTAYYFHGTFRCLTCTNMEKYSKEAIGSNFKDALASGKLEFRAVNVEEPENEHYTKDYQLYTKSLILSLTKDGLETKSKNLDKIWRYAGNKKKFIEYVTKEVSDFLKDAE